MKTGKIILGILVLAAAVGLIRLTIKLLTGAFAVLTGALNTLLGIAVIVALLVIVIWMFSYAKKH